MLRLTPVTLMPSLAKLAAVLALALAGCATPVLKPSVDVPGGFAAASASEAEPEVAWWESYGDPVLSDLIRRAARENRSIRIAAERVRAARAGETVSRSWLLPSIGVSATGVKYSTGYSSSTKQFVPDIDAAAAGVTVSWEIDLAGRLRSGVTAAAAETLAAEHGVRGVRLLVLTDVASNYFTMVGALRQLETVSAISAAQDETLRLVTARERAGLASSFDVERARTAAATARATIPPLQTLVAVARHRIAVLIGDQAANAATIVPWSGAIMVPEIVPGQPADLLERRPDLLAAHARLEAANFRRRQAAAEWFPRLFVSALFGRQSSGLNENDLGVARFTNASALLTTPIFDFGRTRAINEIAESVQSETLLRYEDAIVRALEDVENTLVALRDERTRTVLLQSAAASAEAALGRAQSLYDRRQIDLLPLLDAQRARLSVRVNANESNTNLRLDSVQLFKALGGGWQVFEPGAAPAASAVRPSNSPTLVYTNEDPS
jgi:outer membrane protein, multidrug efflux system